MKVPLFIYLFILPLCANCVSFYNGALSLDIFNADLKLNLNLRKGTELKLSAQIGVNVNLDNIKECTGLANCLQFDDIRLTIEPQNESFQLTWTTQNTSAVLQDCYLLNTTKFNWFGGPERFNQEWPIEKLQLSNYANVIQQDSNTAVAEPYWLNSQGAYIFVDARTPLFIDQNNWKDDSVCFIAKQDEHYYSGRRRIFLQYNIAALDDPKVAHLHAVQYFLGKPTGHPNYKMINRPVWSTWARYKKDVNDTVCLKFAEEIVEQGYSDGQFEIDDDWEECYGSLTFSSIKFGDINNTIQTIKNKGFRTTLWVHPFVNTNCEKPTQTGLENDFFIRNTEGNVLMDWWDSDKNGASMLDFSNEEVRLWFKHRLNLLKNNHGLDSFKFDAGEVSWAPHVSLLYGDVEMLPNKLTTDYVRTCAELGDMVEVRSAYKSQDLPIFVRMLDKDSTWGHNNGLYTLVTTLLQMNMNGYTMVLPDMVGGNGYNGAPSAELFVRWLQANIFMPSIQFSYVPWDYVDSEIDVIGISKKYVALHDQMTDIIVMAMNDSIVSGHPVNGPIWWVDANDTDAHAIDTEFLLGRYILVAPVLEEGAVSRDIYLPDGKWYDGNTEELYVGRQYIKDYPAPIDILPFFIEESVYSFSKLLRQSKA